VKLLIAIPIKTEPHYQERFEICKQTWLQGIYPVDGVIAEFKEDYVHYKGFSDADLGLKEINQHDNANDPIRTWRTKLMVKYAYDHGYDYVFRVDSDAYVWVNRLLNCGFEQHDYMGWCLQEQQAEWCVNTGHGGVGFFLSRKAMEIVMNASVEKYADRKYWGDLCAGQQLYKAGIHCHRDSRFLDGSSHKGHHGNIAADELPADHKYISVHPVLPVENMLEMHRRFGSMSDQTTPPEKQLGE
jgi:hypothetical protein